MAETPTDVLRRPSKEGGTAVPRTDPARAPSLSPTPDPAPSGASLQTRAVTEAATDLAELADRLTAGSSLTSRSMAGFVERFLPALHEQRPSVRGMVALPLLVHGAERGASDPARPAAVAHLLWWMAARYLDDLVDHDGHASAAGADPERARAVALQTNRDTLCALAIGCHLAAEVLDAAPADPAAAVRLRRELSRAWLDGIDGQLRDLAESPGAATLDGVLLGYRGKTGAPYGMAAALAAILAGCDEARSAAWRAFGAEFGTLRQLANDRRDLVTGRHEDLRNRTATYHLVLLLQSLPMTQREDVLKLTEAAANSAEARTELAARLTTPGAVRAFTSSVAPLFTRAHGALELLGGEPAYVSALHGLVEETATMLHAGR